MNIGLMIIMIIGGALGALSTLYCILGLPFVLIYKVYRKVRYGISLFD